MMDFLGPIGMMQGGADVGIGPAVTITIADFGGGAIRGFVASGGYVSGTIGGLSGGSLSAQPLPGFVCDAIYDNGSELILMIDGNATTALATLTALVVDGVSCTVSAAPSYYAPDNNTLTTFNRSSTFAPSSRVIQLV